MLQGRHAVFVSELTSGDSVCIVVGIYLQREQIKTLPKICLRFGRGQRPQDGPFEPSDRRSGRGADESRQGKTSAGRRCQRSRSIVFPKEKSRRLPYSCSIITARSLRRPTQKKLLIAQGRGRDTLYPRSYSDENQCVRPDVHRSKFLQQWPAVDAGRVTETERKQDLSRGLTPGLTVSHPKSSCAQKLNEKQSGEGFHVGFTLKRKVTAGASKSPLKFTIELNIVGCFPGLFSGLLCSEEFEVLLPPLLSNWFSI
jgi:hypothetical protein